MATLKLTVVAIERLKPTTTQTDYWDQVLKGFGLRVSPGGTKTFIIQYRKDGKNPRRLRVGHYPEMDLALAREEASKMLRLVAEGKDPAQVRQVQILKNQEDSHNTFETVRTLFLEKHCNRNLRQKTIGEYERVLKSDDFKEWEKRPISSISRQDVISLLDKIVDRGSETMANRTLAYLRKMMNWAVEDRHIIKQAPTDHVKPPRAREAKRDRVLTDAELQAIWRACSTEPLFGPLVRLLVATGQRLKETSLLRWDNLTKLDTDTPCWEIPKENAKNGLPHTVPLSSLALGIIKSCPRLGELAFTSTGTTPLSGFSKVKARLDEKSGVSGWRLHDLRRTAVTRMADIGVLPHIIEATVNHISGTAKAGVAGVYNRAQYLDERRNALNLLGQYLGNIIKQDISK